MHKHLIKFIIAFCFVCLFSSINGCGDKTEPPTKPAAVSKKIVAKKSETAPVDVAVSVNVPAKQGAEIKEVKTGLIDNIINGYIVRGKIQDFAEVS